MKRMTLLVVSVAVLLWGADIQARTIREMSQLIKNPMEIKASASERMNVMFPHAAHRGVNCLHCHHEAGDDGRYVACTQCHETPGPRERDPMSMFMAFHSKGSDRSCVGCHTKAAQDAPDAYAATFKGCRPCHLAPTARKAIEAARAASK